jgi:hypothetical protein
MQGSIRKRGDSWYYRYHTFVDRRKNKLKERVVQPNV